MSKKHPFEKLRDRVKVSRIGEARIVRLKDVKGICHPNYEKTDSRPLISPKIMDVKNFVMVYNEIGEQGGVKMHEWYTGYSNIRNAYGKVKLVVNTVYIPEIVDEREIEKIARFLSEIDKRKVIDYRINRFNRALSHEKISRNPYPEEIERAYSIVAKYMKNSVIGKSCVRERKIKEKTGWITVLPDGTVKRRSLADYREENKKMLAKSVTAV